MSCCSRSTSTDFAFDTPDAALRALCTLVNPVGTESIDWRDATGRVLAADAVADRPSPSCDVSAMDGYALRREDCVAGVVGVAGEVLIGLEPQAMPRRMSLQIVTGAPVPVGADVVIKREDVIEHGGTIELSEQLIESLKPGMNIRRVGENTAEGTPIECAGRVINAPVMGMLTGFGTAKPLVYRKVRLGIITTGNEVVAPGTTPTQWQLRDSNAPSLIALCDQHRWIRLQAHIHAPDTIESIKTIASDLIKACDALVFTGGVSMGDHDHVPEIVRLLGAQTIFHKLPQRPGKPALGAVLDGKPVFGLPGNPVSVMVTGHRLMIPALAIRAGIQQFNRTPRMVRIVNYDQKTLGLWWSRLARIVDDDRVELIESRGSGDVPSSASSDGFVELAPGQSGEGPWPFWSWSG